MTLADFSSSDAVAAVSGGAHNLLEMLDRRSPGARTEGQLTKTKHHQRALARMRGAPHVPAAAPVPTGQPELAAILLDVPQPLPVDLAAPPLAELGPLPSLDTLIGSPGGGGSLIGSPGGGGGGSGHSGRRHAANHSDRAAAHPGGRHAGRARAQHLGDDAPRLCGDRLARAAPHGEGPAAPRLISSNIVGGT